MNEYDPTCTADPGQVEQRKEPRRTLSTWQQYGLCIIGFWLAICFIIGLTFILGAVCYFLSLPFMDGWKFAKWLFEAL